MASALPDRTPLPDLVDESFEEACFLWTRWESELSSLTRNLDEVWSWTEDRLQGALAGIQLAPDRLVELALEAIEGEDLSRIVVAFAALGASSDERALRVLMEALNQATGAKLDRILRALEVAGSHAALSRVAGALASGSEAHQAALSRLKTFRSVKPGPEMRVAFDSKLPDLQIVAMRAVRFTDEDGMDDWIHTGLQQQNLHVRCAAIESGIARGSLTAWKAVLIDARQPVPETSSLLRWIALLGGPESHELIYGSLRNPDVQREALWALGHIGTRHAVEYCIKGMEHEKLARFAGEAYCHVTGADLNRDNLAGAEPSTAAPSFEDENLDASLVPAPEDLWPMPDPAAVQQHWLSIQSRFADGIRYVRGEPASTDALLRAIETGPMLRRADLVVSLAARSKGAYDVATRAFTQRQREMMSRSRSAVLAGGD